MRAVLRRLCFDAVAVLLTDVALGDFSAVRLEQAQRVSSERELRQRHAVAAAGQDRAVPGGGGGGLEARRKRRRLERGEALAILERAAAEREHACDAEPKSRRQVVHE